MANILVMMSTYNGSEFLKIQLDSLLNQIGVETKIIIRDDGSEDGTQEILEEYAQKGKLEWFQGENVGPCKSFLDLLYNSGEFEYYAFCDQDDYWYPEKLYAAIQKLTDRTKPQLYFSKKNIVDKNLRKMEVEDTKIVTTSYGAALLNGVAYGCTMVLNLKAVQLLKTYYPTKTSMHDVWAYRVISALGDVIYDEKSYIDYRQHGNNSVGVQKSFFERIKINLSNFKQRKYERYRSQAAEELYEAFGMMMSTEKRNMTYELAKAPESVYNRIKLVFNKNLDSQSKRDLFIIKIFILLGWI